MGTRLSGRSDILAGCSSAECVARHDSLGIRPLTVPSWTVLHVGMISSAGHYLPLEQPVAFRSLVRD